jgi:hypothetical protein
MEKQIEWFILYNSNTKTLILWNQTIIVKWKAKGFNKKKGGINNENDENEKKNEVVHCDNVSTLNFLMFLLSMCEFVCKDNITKITI